MNRYEALEAPTSLKPKDLAVHVRMRPHIPKEVSGPARAELINVKTRLHDELTTARYGRQLPAGQLRGYREVCRAVSGSDGEPIPDRFFADELAAFTAGTPDAAEMSPAALEREIRGLADPWRVQAWAAQVARIATSAEVSDPDNAPAAWARALRLYDEFFERAQVEQSHTWRNDEAGRAGAEEAWDSFLADEVAAIQERMAAYGRRQEGRAVAACAAVLASREVAAVDPDAGAAARGSVLGSYLDGIGGAAVLADATRLHREVPADVRAGDRRGELDRALLGAMTREAELFVKGFGDVDAVVAAAASLGLGPTSHDVAPPVVRPAIAAFYDACASFARQALAAPDDGPDAAVTERRAQAADLLALLPASWQIGRDSDSNEPIRTEAAAELLLFKVHGDALKARLDELMQTPADSPAEEAALDDVVEFIGSHPALAQG
ncbi:MAG: hypothetical protein LBS56_06060, partial [Propionibacteriaceae bacterium]|nr:hypothetical protein [Propionibacteriaceae bacterium]